MVTTGSPRLMRAARRARLCAITCTASQAALARNRPEGRWLSPTPYLRSRMAFSISAWRRWSASSSSGGYAPYWPAGSLRGGPISLNAQGGRPNGRAIKRMVKIHAAAAGLVSSAVHPYTLRHSCTTHLLKGGANLGVI